MTIIVVISTGLIFLDMLVIACFVCYGVVKLVRAIRNTTVAVSVGSGSFMTYLSLQYIAVQTLNPDFVAKITIWSGSISGILFMAIISIDEPGINTLRMKLIDFGRRWI